MKKKILAVVFLALSSSAHAEISGHGSRLDHRIQTVMYTPDNVFRIKSVVGRSSLIQFPAGETVNQRDGLITSGDPNAWDVGVNGTGNLISVKPKTIDDPDTNLIVNTNLHTYAFELTLLKDNQVRSATYILRFDYPHPPKVGETPFKGRDLNQDPCSGGIQNRSYTEKGDPKKGDLTLAPSEVWDNGTFTCFRFPTNAPRPVIYQVLADGTETLVNTHQVYDIEVVHNTSKEFRLRLDKMVLQVNSLKPNAGWYNYNRTTTGDVLEVK